MAESKFACKIFHFLSRASLRLRRTLHTPLERFILIFYKHMKQTFKLAILGGSGKSGKYLVNALINQNIPIKLLLRTPETFTIMNTSIEVVKGDARQYESIRSVVEGCQAVISTLGQPRGESSIFSQATRNVIKAMKEFNLNRYIVTTGLNVDTPSDRKSEEVRMATEWMKANYPKTTLDKQVEYDVLSESRVDWTLVRLPLIRLTDERSEILTSLEDCPGNQISSADLAAFLIDQLSNSVFVRKAPFIANVRKE